MKKHILRVKKTKHEYFVIRFDFDEDLVAEVRSIPTARFQANRKEWVVRVSKETAPFIKELLEMGFNAEESVVDKILEYEDKKQTLFNLSDAEYASLKMPDLPFPVYPFQKAGIKYMIEAKRCFNADDMGLGKQHPVDTNVLTPSGYVKIGNIKKGDYVIGSNGRKTEVTGVYPQGVKPSYEIYFSDGSSVEAGLDHLWSVGYRKAGRYLDYIILSTRDLIRRGNYVYTDIKGRTRAINLNRTPLFIPMLKSPVEFDGDKNLPIPPYLMGQLISDGSLSNGTPVITSFLEDSEEIINNIKNESGCPEIGMDQIIDENNSRRINILGITEKVKNLHLDCLSVNKRIPDEYMRSSVKSRIKLLHGLMDGDGHISKTKNRISYSTSSPGLAKDIRCLVECLGGISSIKEYYRVNRPGDSTEFNVRIRLPEKIDPFSISRKLSRYNPGRLASPKRSVSEVRYKRDVESVCISVEAKDKLYATEHAILTHNTIQTIVSAEIADAFPMIVICPNRVKKKWRKEVAKWIPHRSSMILDDNNFYYNHDIMILNYEAITKYLVIESSLSAQFNDYKIREHIKDIGIKSVVLDESHYVKSGRSKRTKAARKLCQDVEYIWMLSGTIVNNRPEELIPQLQIMRRLNDFGGYQFFTNRYCDAQKGFEGTRDNKGAKHLVELNTKLKERCLVRRTKLDVRKELPGKSIFNIPVEIDNREEYELVQDDVLEWIDRNKKALHPDALGLFKDEESIIYSQDAIELQILNALRIVTARGKINGCIEWIGKFLERDKKLVVFANHISIQQKIIKSFPGCARILGGMSTIESDRNEQRFKKDGCNLIVCSLKGANTGIDLVSAYNYFCVELDWTPSTHDQAEDRLNRIGQHKKVNCFYPLAVNTIDEDMFDLHQEKRSIMQGIMDGKQSDNNYDIRKELIKKLKKKGHVKVPTV